MQDMPKYDMLLSMGIPSFLIKYCNAFAPAYYDSIWFVTRTRHSRSNLLNRIFITRGRRTVYSSSAWLIKETVHPLPSHYNKNKHSFRGFIYASGAMLILYQTRIRSVTRRRILLKRATHGTSDTRSMWELTMKPGLCTRWKLHPPINTMSV